MSGAAVPQVGINDPVGKNMTSHTIITHKDMSGNQKQTVAARK